MKDKLKSSFTYRSASRSWPSGTPCRRSWTRRRRGARGGWWCSGRRGRSSQPRPDVVSQTSTFFNIMTQTMLVSYTIDLFLSARREPKSMCVLFLCKTLHTIWSKNYFVTSESNKIDRRKSGKLAKQIIIFLHLVPPAVECEDVEPPQVPPWPLQHLRGVQRAVQLEHPALGGHCEDQVVLNAEAEQDVLFRIKSIVWTNYF